MEKTIKILNQLESGGFIGRYAIGGAMAATFYAEPLLTYDLDVFVSFPKTGALVSLTQLYDELRTRGYPEQRECVDIEGVAVQFLPADYGLLAEALGRAVEVPYGAEKTRVFTAEHLAAICLQTGRSKDRERFRLLSDEAGLDSKELAAIAVRHGLGERLKQWTS